MSRHRRPRSNLTAVAVWVGVVLFNTAFWAGAVYLVWRFVH